MSPPRNKDKFAALAHHQQEKEQQQQGEAEPPSQPQMEISPPEPAQVLGEVGLGAVEAEVETPVVVPTPVKRDKSASMTAHQAAVGGAAPKRDKFASMAAHRSGETPPSTPPAAPTAAAPTIATAPDADAAATSSTIDINLEASAPQPPSVAAAVVAAAPPRRDKFASLASRQQTGGAGGTSTGDSVSTAVIVTLDQAQQEAAEERNRSLQQRMDQRDHVWSDLCKAEAQTIQLLQTAQTTATHLAAAASYNNSNSENDSKSNNKHKNSIDGARSDPDKASSSQVTAIQKCMKDYQSTVEQIHALLAPHADLVKAYQAPTRLNRMYQARVELRLADEKQNLLQEFLRLQKEEETAATTTATTATEGGSAAIMEGVESESSKRKREVD
jgi:hypothetical protein